MMSDDDRDIPTRIEELYRAELEIDPAPSAEIDAAWQRFSSALPVPMGAPPNSSGSYTAAHVGAALALGLAVGGFGGAVLTSTSAPPGAETEPFALVDAGVAEVESIEEARMETPPDAGHAAAVTTPRAPERAQEPWGADALAAERRLIDAARFALARGDAEAALRSLRTHRRRYPHGQLAEERDGIEVSALVHAGEVEEARSRAQTFARRYPSSLMLEAIQRAVASTRGAE